MFYPETYIQVLMKLYLCDLGVNLILVSKIKHSHFKTWTWLLLHTLTWLRVLQTCFPSVGSLVKKMPAMQEMPEIMGLIPGFGRSPGGGHSNPLQYSCLEHRMDRGALSSTVHRSQRIRQDWSDWAQPICPHYSPLITVSSSFFFNKLNI